MLEDLGVVGLVDKDPERNKCEAGAGPGETDLLSVL